MLFPRTYHCDSLTCCFVVVYFVCVCVLIHALEMTVQVVQYTCHVKGWFVTNLVNIHFPIPLLISGCNRCFFAILGWTNRFDIVWHPYVSKFFFFFDQNKWFKTINHFVLCLSPRKKQSSTTGHCKAAGLDFLGGFDPSHLDVSTRCGRFFSMHCDFTVWLWLIMILRYIQIYVCIRSVSILYDYDTFRYTVEIFKRMFTKAFKPLRYQHGINCLQCIQRAPNGMSQLTNL